MMEKTKYFGADVVQVSCNADSALGPIICAI